MSLVKKIHFSEKTNIEFRFEVLNVFNNINFLVGGSAAVDDGQITATNLAIANAELFRCSVWDDHRRLPGYFDDERSWWPSGAVCIQVQLLVFKKLSVAKSAKAKGNQNLRNLFCSCAFAR